MLCETVQNGRCESARKGAEYGDGSTGLPERDEHIVGEFSRVQVNALEWTSWYEGGRGIGRAHEEREVGHGRRRKGAI